MYDARIVKIEKLPNWRVERHGPPRGGGKRHGVRDVVRGADLAAKQLGSGATHVALCNKIGPYFRHWCKVLAKVGRHCEIADEWLTRGARNEIHICDSNMNGSSEREVISRR